MPKSPSAFDACGNQSTQAAPSPKNTRANVPINSAVSFCGKLYIKEPPGRGTSRVRCDRKDSIWNAKTNASLTASPWFQQLPGDGGYRSVNRSQPIVAIRLCAAGQRKKFFLELARDRPCDAFADLNLVHRADRRDLHSRSAEENFIDNVKHLARDDL